MTMGYTNSKYIESYAVTTFRPEKQNRHPEVSTHMLDDDMDFAFWQYNVGDEIFVSLRC